MAELNNQNIANYSQLSGTPAAPIPDLNNVPPNYESLIGDNLSAADRERSLTNREALTAIENKAKSLEQKLPDLDRDTIKQLSFSGDISKLRDCMVIVLHSPSSNDNPNLANSPVKTNQIIAEGVTEIATGTRSTVENTDLGSLNQAKTDTFEAFDRFSTTKEFTNDEVEKLDQNFYDEGAEKRKKKTIFLPLPKQIIDSHAHEVDGFSNNPAQLIAGLAIGGLNAISNALGGGPPGTRGGTGKIQAPGVGQYIFNNLQLATRKAFNPAVETLYRSPTLRNWQWNIEYSPSSKKEADAFIEIVEMLKQHSYPTQDLGGILYTFPGTVDFYFRINGEKSEVLPQSLQKCFLKSVQIDYTQQGFYAHFKDGNPVTMVLTLDISETRLLSRSDIEKPQEAIQDGYIAKYDEND